MDRRLILTGALAATVALVASSGVLLALGTTFPLRPAADDATLDADSFTFSTPAYVDTERRAGEPSIQIDLAGHVYVAAPCGFVGCNQGYFWRSVDHGETWEFVSNLNVNASGVAKREWRASVAPGGGDSDLAVTPLGRVYYADLYLAEISVSSSDDYGLTWTSSHPAVSNVPFGDRQWISVLGEDMVYVAFNQIPYGPTVTKSTDGGRTWVTLPAVPPEFVEKWWTIGNMITNQWDGTLFVPFTACDDDGECAHDVWVTVSRDGGYTWTQHRVHAGADDTAGIFPSMAQDHSGNVYVTWSEQDDSGARSVYLASSRDHGETWSAPSLVSADVENAVMPWVVAGSAGRVGVAYYGSMATGDAQETESDAEWNVHYAYATDALGGEPSWTTMRVTPTPNHYGSICLQGLACTGDRSLLDFFDMAADPWGRVHVVYGDNADLCPPEAERPCPRPFVTHVKQTEGPSLHASQDEDEPREKPGRGRERGNLLVGAGTWEWLTSDEARERLYSGEAARRIPSRFDEVTGAAGEVVGEAVPTRRVGRYG